MMKVLIYGLVGTLLLTACGGAVITPTPQSTPAPPPAPTQQPQYGHAPDYTWVRGQLQFTQIQGNCIYIEYDPTGADQYGGKFSLAGDVPSGFKNGEFVLLRGQIFLSMRPGKPMCPGTAYAFTSMEHIAESGPAPAAGATAAPPAESKSGHAPDYTWLRGYLQLSSTPGGPCNAIVYGPLESDPYGGKMFLIINSLEGFKDGDFVTVYGQLDQGRRDIPPCPGLPQGYVVNKIERLAGSATDAGSAADTASATAVPGPAGTAGDPHYGHAADYSWLRGQIQVTRIQGSCTYLVYDPSGSDQYSGRVVPVGDLTGFKDGDYVLVTGTFSNAPAPMCPGAKYAVTSIQRQ